MKCTQGEVKQVTHCGRKINEFEEIARQAVQSQGHGGGRGHQGVVGQHQQPPTHII